jgi:hypothetical protein
MDKAEEPVDINYLRLLKIIEYRGVTPDIAQYLDILSQLPEGATILRFYYIPYDATAKGGILMIVNLPDRGEADYYIDVGDDGKIVVRNPQI